ncbi:hypothetical protein pdam_00008520 [Pocillopora damicornis]|uniref:G-protein coupled receptors family 1 profile domain-containing protein n=1 Tax=Pocillopora damicornis TaxID=46731 RepID=A0A3M6U4N8_POCDA|nr:hypothetical protein pdam_00008520 [Pocillopora damicornis]
MNATTNSTQGGTQTEETSLHSPSKLLYRCLATTDLLVGLVSQPLAVTYWMSLRNLEWYGVHTNGVTLCEMVRRNVECYSVHKNNVAVDRLLALLLGISYKQIVTLKRMCITTATFWILSVAAASFSVSHTRISIWYGIVVILSCSVISIASYTKIFRALKHHHAQVQDHIQQQSSQTTALNMARYRKAVSSALWVQLALAVCYVPKVVVLLVLAYRKTYSSHVVVIDAITSILTYFNSTLNPFLYCWKVRERNVEWYSVHTNGVALREMAQRNIEWYSVHTNSVALRDVGQRNFEWYSVHTNGVALREMAQHGVGGTAYMETV